jgi:hypothetical protein
MTEPNNIVLERLCHTRGVAIERRLDLTDA